MARSSRIVTGLLRRMGEWRLRRLVRSDLFEQRTGECIYETAVGARARSTAGIPLGAEPRTIRLVAEAFEEIRCASGPCAEILVLLPRPVDSSFLLRRVNVGKEAPVHFLGGMLRALAHDLLWICRQDALAGGEAKDRAGQILVHDLASIHPHEDASSGQDQETRLRNVHVSPVSELRYHLYRITPDKGASEV